MLRSTDREIGDSLTLTRDGTPVTLTIVGEVFDPGNNDGLVLTQADPGTTLTTWLVSVADGTDPGEYADTLQQALDPLGLTAHLEGTDGADELVVIIDALAGLLTLMLVTVAGLGVLNAVVLDVRERVHDIGIHKALGMTPRQTLTTVLSSVVLIGLVGGLVGVPAGVVLHGILLPAMGDGAGVELPQVVLSVFGAVGARGVRARRAGARHGRRAAARRVGGADPYGDGPADGVAHAATRVVPMGAAIEVTDLAKAYGELQAVDGVTFDVGEGEFFGILGPNGAGKTTILEMVEGLRRPDAGTITLLGESPWPRNPGLLPRIGVQLQSTAFFERLTAREQIRTMASLYAVGPEVADEWLERVGLVDKADTRVGDLSGGQAQRLSIACALVHDPEVVFLDEPTAALDPQARRNLWELLAGLNDSGRTVVLTTHYMDEAEALCDRVAIIDHGRILELDTPANLVRGLDAPTRITVATGQLTPEEAGAIAGVDEVVEDPAGVVLSTREPVAVLTALAQQEHLAGIQVQTGTLEDVFLSLTGREYRA